MPTYHPVVEMNFYIWQNKSLREIIKQIRELENVRVVNLFACFFIYSSIEGMEIPEHTSTQAPNTERH